MRREVFTALAAAVCVTTPAAAGVERLQHDTGPALELDLPDGWSVERDQRGTLYAGNPGRTGWIVASIIRDSPYKELQRVAALSFSGALCAPYPGWEEVRIDGHSGLAFHCQPASMQVDKVRAVFLRLDDRHVAALSQLRDIAAPAADARAMEAVAATIRFLPARPGGKAKAAP